ncbi:hypothetical protein [Sandaracinus amylolyticus]|uniref:Uncharacterized protein n=1 Tax=Sandaracinus amylolyticus TaxID=927083 RepID=A0A0F6SH85_9BACT|nr:hypothetical protein [Sandaracinus amylolyticus]AKF10004.1 hypothetical protein DB32_007153 [Sandaracinus amylolyticus]
MNIGDYSEWRRHRGDRAKYACFRCRVCFKWPHERAASVSGQRRCFARPLSVPTCPHCRATMRPMGYTYEPPPRQDRRAWERDARRYAR